MDRRDKEERVASLSLLLTQQILQLRLRLLRRKMDSVEKYFQRSHFPFTARTENHKIYIYIH